MSKVKIEILGLSSSQTHTGSFTLILGEVDGPRRVPIVIGMFEAQAIAIEIEKIPVNRPMTHDLFRSFAAAFDFKIESVIIYKFEEGVFYSNIIASNKNNTVEIDARPSDAIALALRFNVPIYVSEDVMSEAGISEQEPKKTAKKSSEKNVAKNAPGKTPENIKDYTADQLRIMLEEALSKEDYERAASIRDELNRRN